MQVNCLNCAIPLAILFLMFLIVASIEPNTRANDNDQEINPMALDTARYISDIPIKYAPLVSEAARITELNIFALMRTVGGQTEGQAQIWTTEPVDADLTPFWDEFERQAMLLETEA